MSKRSELKAGAALSYVLMFFSAITNFLIIRFLTIQLGEHEYGLYAMIGSLAGTMAILDFGIGATITRYVAKYRAEQDEKGEENFLATCLIIYGVIVVFVLALGWIFYHNFNAIVTFLNRYNTQDIVWSAYEMQTGRSMFIVFLVGMALSLPMNAFRAIMNGREKFIVPRVLNIVRLVLRVAAIYTFISLGFRSVTVVVIDVVLNLTMQIITMLYVILRMKVKVKLYRWNNRFAREIFTFSILIFLTMVYDQIFWKVDQVIIGIMLSRALVTVCTFGVMVNVYYMQFSTAVSEVFLPRVTKMVVQGADGTVLTDFMIKVGRIQMIIMGGVLVAFYFFGQAFYALYVPGTKGPMWQIAIIVMIPLTIPLIQNTGIAILRAKNKHAFRSIVYFLIAVLNIGVTILLVDRYGILGAPTATGLALALGNGVIINIYYKKVIGIEVGRFFKEVLLYLAPALIAAAGVGFLLQRFVLHSLDVSWLNFLLVCILFTGVYGIIQWFLGMNAYEKGLAKRVIERVLPMKFKED